MPIEPPKIPSRRDRLVVSPERREEARAGMGGEQTKAARALAPAAETAPAPVVETPAAPAAPETAAVAPAPTPQPVPAPPLATATDAAPTPAPAPDLPAALPAEPAPAPVAAVSPAPAAKPAAAGAKRRVGRPAAAPDAVLMEPEHAVKIPESVWEEIRLSLVLFPKGEDLPRNIKAYLVAAHRAYDAQLRKQGKLPVKQAADK